ncbi:MAG: helix-hairpin-helix domain-containing protein [bacterium]|nr:helix-hairpin-helix domain-containing protein [bacterium]
MRIAGFLALAFLFPAFAHAADLININTADAATLDTLPHIGAVTAQKIIDYRTVHGPFAHVEDLQKVSGIGSGSNYADIAPLITVGDTATPDPSPTQTESSTPPDTPSDTANTTETTIAPPPNGYYLPIPMLRIVTSGSRTVSSGAETAFTAAVYDSKGNKRDDALVRWSFGDGMQRAGASVFHKYYDPGEYLAIVHATTADGGDALAEMVVTVKDASIKIASVSSRGITLINNDSRTLDLSLWRLSMGGQEFKIPENTQILAGRTILFPSQVIELPTAQSALLLYPSGEVAAAYPAIAAIQNPQPSSGTVSYKKVSEVEPILSARANDQVHENAVGAPAAETELAAAGAALSSPAPTSRAMGIFKSPWTLGFLGVVALAGSVFIFL